MNNDNGSHDSRQATEQGAAEKATGERPAESIPGVALPAAPCAPEPAPEVPITLKLAKTGQFLVGGNGKRYFLPHNQGVPLDLDARSFSVRVRQVAKLRGGRGALRDILDTIRDFADEHGARVRVEAVSAVDHQTGHLLVNLGGGVVVVLWQGAPYFTRCLHGDVLFVDAVGFRPLNSAKIYEYWHTFTGEYSGLMNLAESLPPAPEGGLGRNEQIALLLAAWLGFFIGPWARARPILCLVGRPGTGKTEMGRRLGLAFYGEGFDVAGTAGAGRSTKDLAAALVERPLAIRDDVNQSSGEMMDLLCRAATGARIELATMYETLGLSTFEPKAALVITAQRPAWAKREDVASRLLPLRLSWPPKGAGTAADRERRVLDLREAIWTETLVLLALAFPDGAAYAPITRFDDWELRVKLMFERVGFGGPLASALAKMDAERVAMVTEADPYLALLAAFAASPGVAERWYTAAELFDALLAFAGVQGHISDPHSSGASVRNPRSLAALLHTLEEEGSLVVVVTRGAGHAHDNVLKWNVRPRDVNTVIE